MQAHAKTFDKWKPRLAPEKSDANVDADAAARTAALPAAPAAGSPPRSQAQHLPPPRAVSDVKLDVEAVDGVDLQRAQVELLLAMPALYHRQDPTRPPKIWNPFGELRPGFLPKYNEHLKARGNADHRLIGLVPVMYLA